MGQPEPLRRLVGSGRGRPPRRHRPVLGPLDDRSARRCSHPLPRELRSGRHAGADGRRDAGHQHRGAGPVPRRRGGARGGDQRARPGAVVGAGGGPPGARAPPRPGPPRPLGCVGPRAGHRRAARSGAGRGARRGRSLPRIRGRPGPGVPRRRRFAATRQLVLRGHRPRCAGRGRARSDRRRQRRGRVRRRRARRGGQRRPGRGPQPPRAPFPHPVAERDRWMLGGLATVFDQSA